MQSHLRNTGIKQKPIAAKVSIDMDYVNPSSILDTLPKYVLQVQNLCIEFHGNQSVDKENCVTVTDDRIYTEQIDNR